MSRTTILGALGALFIIALGASSAQAQATRTWISGVGDDVNPCSRTAPCKTWPGAISKTAAGGEIDALDPGGFGAVTITKSITLAVEGVGEGGILVAGTNGITINAGVNDVVIIRGMQIDGGPLPSSSSLAGIRIIQAGAVEIQNSTIRNFNSGLPTGYGVMFTPGANTSSGQPPQLFISDTTITTNGLASASTGGGILVQPNNGASATVTLNNVNIVNNVLGYRADASLTTGTISTSITNSTIAGNAFAGVSAFTFGATGTPSSTIDLMRTTVANNGGAGLNANGVNALIRLSNVSLTGNKTAVVVANSGAVATAVTNLNFDNTNPGSTPTSAPSN